MKHLKKLSGILALVALVNVSLVSAVETSYISHIKNAAKYMVEGLIDIAGAYCLCMAITIIHESGHALTGKIIEGAPIRMTIGTNEPFRTPLWGITDDYSDIALSGFNPLEGHNWLMKLSENPLNSSEKPRNVLLISAAGPLFGVLSSIGAFAILRRYTNRCYLTKAACLIQFINNTLGFNGLYGGLKIPKSDGYQVRCALQKLYADQNAA